MEKTLHVRNSQRNHIQTVENHKKWKILLRPKAENLSILLTLSYLLWAWNNLSIKMGTASTSSHWGRELIQETLRWPQLPWFHTIHHYQPTDLAIVHPLFDR